MRVKFWGVRGSYPAPGLKTNRYGGNTCCVQVCPQDGTTLILDAGTGIRRLSKDLGQSNFGQGKGICNLLISHTHWDHIQGLPFFAPLYVKGNEIVIYARQREVNLRTIFCSQTQEPYFPVSLDDVAANVSYRELVEGSQFEVGCAKVSCARLNHPYISIGYRIEDESGSLAYISDTAPFDHIVLGYDYIASRPDLEKSPKPSDNAILEAMRLGVLDLCRNADLVIYDTMFEMDEYLAYPHWGHSSPSYAVEIAQEAGAACLALFHHHPLRTDDQIDEILKTTQNNANISVIAATEGMELDIKHSQDGV